MTISKEIHSLIEQLSIPDKTKLAKEVAQLSMNGNMPLDTAEEIVYKKYYGDQYREILKQEIIVEKTAEIDKTLESKLDAILTRIDQSESNLKSILNSKTSFYINQGYDEDKALQMAKAELVFDSPDTSKLEYNIKTENVTTESKIDEAADLLSQL